MKKVKIIANYLPQFHRTEENDRWWGEGYTDWVAVKNAKPFYAWQYQPIQPLGGHYYSLDDVEEIRRQAALAKKYGVDAFGIYHYWFNEQQQLLTKPAQLLLENKDIDVEFCFIWDNSSWKRTWSNVKHANDFSPVYDEKSKPKASSSDDNGVLAELIYGDEKTWEKHFYDLLPYFRDERYLKVDGKPLFCFFKTEEEFPLIQKMVAFWQTLAKKNGLNGVFCISRVNYKGNRLEGQFCYTPFMPQTFWQYGKRYIATKLAKYFHRTQLKNYDKEWKKTLRNAKKSHSDCYLSGFVKFDDTARRGKKARILKGATAEKFGKYLSELIKISQQQQKELLFLTAWNEWGEGAYLEPDEKDGCAYLEAVKKAVEERK